LEHPDYPEVDMTLAKRKHHSIWFAALCGFVLLTASFGPARADRRVALVVGNSHYSNSSLFLTNPKNDAEDVAAALRGVGFEVVLATDATKKELDFNMAKFARLAIDADAAMFYYAGHAVQYQGRNYLMPTDAEVEDEISFRYQMTPLDDVRSALDRSDGVKIIILDACRNNPVVNALRRKATGEARSIGAVRGGLAKVDKAQGMVVAYSTAADEVAADGEGRNSPFTSAFLKRLREPGLEIEQLFRRVAADVNSQTGGRQRPETYVSLLTNYYLNQTDRIAFDKVKDTSDTAVLQDFIIKYPSSTYVAEAQTRIQRLELAARERQLAQEKTQEAARIADEQRRAEQEAAARKQEEQRVKLAAERERKDREAAQRVADDAQRAKLLEEARQRAADEQRRADQEAALRKQEEQQRLAADRARKEQEAAQRQAEEQQRAKLAEEARARVAEEQRKAAEELRTQKLASIAPQAAADPCEQDRARLARVRSSPALDQVVQFEHELVCEKLRPQLVRLRESLSPPGGAPIAAAAPPPAPAKPSPEKPAAEKPAVLAAAPPADRVVELSPPAKPTSDQEQACKQDESRLAKLRANPSREALVTLERELGCERLRPQIARLRESLAQSN
jgi:uncharacterized caspase-like protein